MMIEKKYILDLLIESKILQGHSNNTPFEVNHKSHWETMIVEQT